MAASNETNNQLVVLARTARLQAPKIGFPGYDKLALSCFDAMNLRKYNVADQSPSAGSDASAINSKAGNV